MLLNAFFGAFTCFDGWLNLNFHAYIIAVWQKNTRKSYSQYAKKNKENPCKLARGVQPPPCQKSSKIFEVVHYNFAEVVFSVLVG